MKRLVTCLALLAGYAAEVEGATITWHASGVIIAQHARPPGLGGAPAGSILDVYLTFDDQAVDLAPAESGLGIYGNIVAVDATINGQLISALWPFPSLGDDFMVGDYVQTWTRTQVLDNVEVNGRFTDALLVAAYDTRSIAENWSPAEAYHSFSLYLEQQTQTPGNLTTSDAMPRVPPSAAFLPGMTFQANGWFTPTEQYFFRASLDSLTAVPVPAAAYLLISGIALIGTAGIRRRRGHRPTTSPT